MAQNSEWGHPMEIKRNAYLEQIHLRENNGFIKVITGIRRSGKSYLLFKLYKSELLERGIAEDHIISIALDNIENRNLREPLALYKHSMITWYLADFQESYLFPQMNRKANI